MHDLTGSQSCKAVSSETELHDPSKTVDLYEVSSLNVETVARPPVVQGSCNIPEFVSPSKLAALLDCAASTVTRQCQSGKFKGAQKTLIDGNESWQIPISSLPPHAQAKMFDEVKAATLARAVDMAPQPPARQGRSLGSTQSRLMFEAYQRSGAVNKERAEAAHAALCMFHDLVKQGYSKGDAEKAVVLAHKVSRATLHRYRAATDGHPVNEWLPRLSPKFKGGRPPVEFTEAAWDYIRAAYLNPSKTPFAVVMENARIRARQNGWVIPSNDAVWYRMCKEPAWVITLGREGPKALERSQPAVKRDYTTLALHELWDSDGRKSDLWCIWPDGTVARPFLIAWCDVRTRVILGVKGCLNPSAEVVLSALCMALERAGTAPDFAKLDNGREYAAKSVTGGQKNRYRFTVKEGEQIGVLTHLGVRVEWSEPGRGQDKPIEAFWNYSANRVDKCPEFEGAYCGRNVVSKPEGFDIRNAIPIAVFQAKVNEVFQRYNTEHRHTGHGMGGRTPMEVYSELAANTIRPAVDPAYLEMCKMGAAQLKPGQGNVYTLNIPGYGMNRYYSESIAELPGMVLGRKHDVYYDLENPQKPISVYDGRVFLGEAALLENIPFRGEGLALAAEHKKRKNARMAPQKAAVKQIKARPNLNPHLVPAAAGLGDLPPMGLTFDPKRRPAPLLPVPEADDLWEPTGKPGELVNRETGEMLRDRYAAAAAAPVIQDAETEDDEERQLAEMERRTREKKRLKQITGY
ncbi:MAG: transposase domain-containing protein [Hydrogenophaga sp.]|nr:transposase domain-containing protein [Hydrogenophaga sp.]